MKKLFFLIVLFFTTALTFAQSQVWVNGYYRSNGTYVSGYYRTSPNNTVNDNWSTVGNVNPYTGVAGTKPRDTYYYSTPSYSTSTYTSTYSTPSYTSTYSTPTYYSVPTYTSTNTIYTGSRGGTYYINSNGNKTYVHR